MEKIRNSKIMLLNCYMLDSNYNHTVNFSNKENQINWFIDKKVFTIDNCSYLRKENGIKVPYYIADLEYCNYALTYNIKDNRYYYYFIMDKIYVNDNVTLLQLKLDVIQTYFFDMNFNKNLSFIDRQHVNRWTDDGLPRTYHLTTVENLEVGEYVQSSITTLYNYESKGGYIVTSSDKLTAKNGGSSIGGGSGNSYRNGYVSENGFVLIKSMEGFSSKSYNLGDGTLTIGYGTTSVYDSEHFNQLAPECTEEQASIVFGESLYTNYSSKVLSAMKEFGKSLDNIKQNEFDAFVSFAYNSGLSGMRNSQIFIDYCNGVDSNTIYNRWLTTNIMAGSDFEVGLRDRRQREANVFLNNEYNFKTISDITTGATITDNDGKGYIPSEYKSTSSSSLGEAIVNSARELIGKPYVWGGNYPPLGSDNGTDCSGLCQWAYHQNGKSITRTTYTQINEGFEILESSLKPGDLVFSNFSSPGVPEHVFLYSGDIDGVHYCVEAPRTGLNIRERSFTWTSEMRARRLL